MMDGLFKTDIAKEVIRLMNDVYLRGGRCAPDSDSGDVEKTEVAAEYALDYLLDGKIVEPESSSVFDVLYTNEEVMHRTLQVYRDWTKGGHGFLRNESNRIHSSMASRLVRMVEETEFTDMEYAANVFTQLCPDFNFRIQRGRLGKKITYSTTGFEGPYKKLTKKLANGEVKQQVLEDAKERYPAEPEFNVVCYSERKSMLGPNLSFIAGSAELFMAAINYEHPILPHVFLPTACIFYVGAALGFMSAKREIIETDDDPRLDQLREISLPGHRRYGEVVDGIRQAMVGAGVDDEVTDIQATTLCMMYEDTRLEHLLTPDGDMPTGSKYAETPQIITNASLFVPIEEKEFRELGVVYVDLVKGILN